MRQGVLLVLGLAAMFAGCSGTSAPTLPANAANLFQLTPASIDLTPSVPSDTFNGQGDVAGVTYTPVAGAACSSPTGDIIVGGNNVPQLDLAGTPLLFTVVSVGENPPATCTITVSGSDGTSASVTVNYSNPPVTDVPTMTFRTVRIAATTTPASLSFTTLGPQEFTLTGFAGTVTAAGSCNGKSGGITVSPASADAATTFYVVPYGQGAISNTCAVTVSGAHQSVTLPVSLAIGALSKLVASPATAQFGCAGSSAPYTCATTQSITLSEFGTHTYAIVTRPTVVGTCAKAFFGPLQLTADGKSYAQQITGSSVSVTYAGLLQQTPPNCSQILMSDSGTPPQRVHIGVAASAGEAPASLTAATPAPCDAIDPWVAVPTAPHGMYVWNPYELKDNNGIPYETYMEQYVIGKDADLCGASILVQWSEVEKTKGVFDWSTVESEAAPYVNHGLRVNLLFVDSSEVGKNNSATPAWVTAAGGDDVATVNCSGQPPYPNYLDPTFEADWEALIAQAVTYFSGQSSISSSIGYMRFGIGAGTESYPAHMTNSSYGPADQQACFTAWTSDPIDWTSDKWLTHTRHIVKAMGALNPRKQLFIALNNITVYPGSGSFYDYPNDAAEVAANNNIGFGTENLGIGPLNQKGPTPPPFPGACNPQANDGSVYWCQAFLRHIGTVPFEFQPIEAVANQTAGYTIDFSSLLQYGLVNNAQIFELYPEDWLEADAPTLPFTPINASPAKWRAALDSTAIIVGAHR